MFQNFLKSGNHSLGGKNVWFMHWFFEHTSENGKLTNQSLLTCTSCVRLFPNVWLFGICFCYQFNKQILSTYYTKSNPFSISTGEVFNSALLIHSFIYLLNARKEQRQALKTYWRAVTLLISLQFRGRNWYELWNHININFLKLW